MLTHPFIYSGLLVLILVLAWVVGGYFFIRNIEQPAYSVLEKRTGYELREYDSYVIAEVLVEAPNQRAALTKGFGLIADYIFGNNTGQQELAMTAPVTSQEEVSESIAMTSPVASGREASGKWSVSFIMPSKYSLETLPTPNNTQIVVREIPARTVAAKRFSWIASNQRIDAKKQELQEALGRDDVIFSEALQYAGYNPPLTAPFMQRHEILVDVEK